MPKSVNCPYCGRSMEFEKNCGTLLCPFCQSEFRMRNNKVYRSEEIAPEMLCYIVTVFGNIAQYDLENNEKYDKFVNDFIKSEKLTKAQYKDILNLYNQEKKGFLGIHKNTYKECITSLKKLLDMIYADKLMTEQEKTEDNLFCLFYSVASILGQVNEEQQKILDFYKDTFEYTKERLDSLFKPQATKEETKKIDIDDTFNRIMGKVINNFLGQTEFLTSLLVAFKRPFVIQSEPKFLKNTICIFTSESIFVSSMISDITNLMFEETLIQGKEEFFDLSLYNEDNNFGQFVADLYTKLNSSTEVIVFKNFKAGSSSVRKVISELIKKGSFVVPTNNENIVINSNNKYFVLISSGSVEDFIPFIGEDTFEKIIDVLKIEELSEEDIAKMIQSLVNTMVLKARAELSIPLTYDTSILEFLKNVYTKRTGLNGLNLWMDRNIYKPLTEFKLKRTAPIEDEVVLGVVENELVILVENNLIALQKFNHREKNKNVEEVKQKLNKIIGLDSVKEYVLKLEDTMTTRKLREEAGLKTASISMNMIFSGNPGTGKTTIARLVSEFLAALGILSKGQFVEVSRGDLVGEHVGETAKKTTEKVNSALGGVLFIDEAYALNRDKNDTFGLEAIDTLVKMMEDNKDNLVVILAGYTNEMHDFLKSNPGLKSRFPNFIEFPDYTPEEMYRIANEIAVSNQYVIDNSCIEPLITYFEGKNIKGRNDTGNGRLARNMVEKAILNQSKRISEEKETDYELLKLSDFELEEKEEFDLEVELNKVIGLENVKDFLRKQYNVLKAGQKRKEAGVLTDTSQALNMIYTGNPGTGKTTVARITANMLKEMGVLKGGQLIEADRSKLVAEYVGQTAIKTTEVFKDALGGVLFIDEAYALSTAGDNFGKEAIDTLVKLVEDYKGEIVVILAGYKKEMKEFLTANSGLESRFPILIDFPDYSAEELFDIFKLMVTSKGFVMDNETEIAAFEKVKSMHKNATASSGNGRMIRNFVDEILRNQSDRIVKDDVPTEEINKIIISDMGISKEDEPKEFNYEEEFDKIVGLERVKDYIRALASRIKIMQERKKAGLMTNNTQTLHMVFTGNPGTGKTMMARTVASLLYGLGIISENKVIETDRAGMVAGYVGQTAIKTTEKVKEAFGGVLFIDEAYTLSQGGANDFGKEAIDTLLKLMDDNRDKLVVILAGYTEEMMGFLNVNPGLSSRFPNVIEFEDYNLDELVEIGIKMFEGNGYKISDGAIDKLIEVLDNARGNYKFGNGRYVRNVFERAINNQAVRIANNNIFTKEVLVNIEAEDIEQV